MDLAQGSPAQTESSSQPACQDLDLGRFTPELTEWDHQVYARITSTRLDPEQTARILTPDQTYPRQPEVLAIHWHPEWIPLELAVARVQTLFPNANQRLIIPTQHNQIMSLDGFSGTEMDCYSSGFNRKVQLLLHFRQERVAQAHVLKSMLEHTFKYRSGQLFEFIDNIVNPVFEDHLQQAAAETGATAELVALTRLFTGKLKLLLEAHETATPPEMIKNKLLSEYFDALREHFPARQINRAQMLLKAVKQIVKRNFSLGYFYRASEVIEEVRAVGGGIVIPHPEQFWPILLADYDVDGYEVWNPQSREYTEFLIKVVNRENKTRRSDRRRLLICMGDDTHMSEKAKDPALQDRAKASREVGLQTAWDEAAIRKNLMLAGVDRGTIIAEYKARLG
ncbi:MAG: hypothetical protein ACOZHQ_18580 [Thermodesulfobacteriota bacterium]